MRVWRLEPLADDDVATVVRRALDRPGARPGRDARARRRRRPRRRRVRPPDLARRRRRAVGDERPRGRGRARESEGIRDADGHVSPRLEDVESAAQQRVLAYDRAGDGHYDTVSAFIKSLRGNDPDAALYWLASMIAAGEDPRFIARRLIISASEDVGQRRSAGAPGRRAAAQALDHVGLPEAQYALAQATTYIATAPKSNRSGRAYWAAAGDVEAQGSLPVPLHLRNAGDRRMKQHGIGVGYRYPHDFEGADVDQQYLPDELADRRYYLPTDQGYEATIARASSGPGGGARRSEEGRQDATRREPRAGDPQERPDAQPRGEPEEARRYPEGRRRLGGQPSHVGAGRVPAPYHRGRRERCRTGPPSADDLARRLVDRAVPTRRAAPVRPVLRLLRRRDHSQPDPRQRVRGRPGARRLQRRLPDPRDRPRHPRRVRAVGAVRADLQPPRETATTRPARRRGVRPDDPDRGGRSDHDRGRRPVRDRPVDRGRRLARASTPATRALYVDLFRINCVAQILFAASIALGEVLVAHRRFLFYGLAPILYTSGIVVGDRPARAVSSGSTDRPWGAVGGAVAHLAIRAIGAHRGGVPDPAALRRSGRRRSASSSR